MTYEYYVLGWVLIGFLTCLWSIYDDLNQGRDFDLVDFILIFVVSWFGPVFTIWCFNEYVKKHGAPVLIKAKDKNER